MGQAVTKINGRTVQFPVGFEGLIGENFHSLWDMKMDAEPAKSRPVSDKGGRLIDWAGGNYVTLSVVFTDIVGGSKMGQLLGDFEMGKLKMRHFNKARDIVRNYGGYYIKDNGDSVLAVFRTSVYALDFAIALHNEPGDERIRIRGGIHSGPVLIMNEDIHASTVDITSRICNVDKEAAIWVSDEAKRHISSNKSPHHLQLRWEEGIRDLKDFGEQKLWKVLPISAT